MKQDKFTYFETRPKGGRLEADAYKKSSLIMGRSCVDVAFIVNKTLVLVERSRPPMKGLWLAGGRIQWDLFQDIYQYAALSAKEHFGITINTRSMTLLKPRFVCFAERPYPEVLLWVLIQISKREYASIVLNTQEQSRTLSFSSKHDLQKYSKIAGIGSMHTKILLELWDELRQSKLVE